MIQNKKSVFFSLDALIAVIIILMTILMVYPVIKFQINKSELSSDILHVFSELKIGEMNNSYVRLLISSGDITNLNNSIIEQVGEFYVKDITKAHILASELIKEINPNENIGLWYGDEFIASVNISSYETARDIAVDRQFISGIQKGGNLTGYSARAYLVKTTPSTYFYFGGYVGDGNISANITYEGKIKEIYMEVAINKEFDVYINDIFSGHYDKSPSEFVPAKYDLSSYINRFHNGSNIIELKGNNLYIAGGYIKASHEGSVIYSGPKKYNLPGIKGIINLYDGIYIPENILSMNIFLHYYSGNKAVFMSFGNRTIFDETSSDERRVAISDSELKTSFDYNEYKGENIPFRFGLKEIQAIGGAGNIDIVLVSDFSGSMKKAINDDSSQGSANIDCNNLEAYPNARKTELAKCLDNIFIDIILNNTSNRLWPVNIYNDNILYYDNPHNAFLIKDFIANNPAGQGKEKTCIACAINKGYDILKNNSNSSDSSRQKFIVLMTDGLPTHCASGSCISNSSVYGVKYCEGYCDFQGGGGSCIYEGCDDSRCLNPIGNALYSANRSKQDQNIKIYTIGFGLVENCNQASILLENIANISGGKFFKSSNTSELEKIYKNISSELLKLSYSEQVSEASGIFSILYPDSYIQINSLSNPEVYGINTVVENKFLNSTYGNFLFSEDSNIIEARVTSYSGPRWTYEIMANNFNIYKMNNFGLNYPLIGDPYSIVIPSSRISHGINNISLTTANNPLNISAGSDHNKIIVTSVRNSSAFSPIASKAEGCIWTIEFSDYSNASINIPENYSGIKNCYFQKYNKAYDLNDALQSAVYNLLLLLDSDKDDLIDIKLSQQDLKVNSFTVSGIPYTWSTEVQIRKWK